jgi:putative selenium metabolism hydrolase
MKGGLVVQKKINELKDDLIKFTQDIIRIPSITGEEGDLAEFVLKMLKEIGIEESLIDEAGNVVGVLRGSGKGPNIMLNGHLDVVPAGNIENWKYEPFGAEIDKEGNIHGRGAADLKGGMSVQFYTMKVLKDLVDGGLSLPGDVIFSQVVYEEAAEMLGMEYLCEKTLPDNNLSFDVVYICEPTNLRVVLGHRGKVEVVVKTKGVTAHSSTPWAGINALEKMVPVLDAVFNAMGKNMKSHDDLGQGSITITNILSRPGALSIVPDECEISIDRRYVPGETLESILGEFEQLFKDIKKNDPKFEAEAFPRSFVEESYTGYKKEVKKYHPVWTTDTEHPFVKKTVKALKAVGQDPEFGYWRFGTDGSMSAGLMEIPTIGYSGMEEQYAHTPEEQVNIDKMLKSLEGYIAIVCELLDIDTAVLKD